MKNLPDTCSVESEKTTFNVREKIASLRLWLHVNEQIQEVHKLNLSGLAFALCKRIKNLLKFPLERTSCWRPNYVSSPCGVVYNVTFRISQLNKPVACSLHSFKYFSFVR